MAKKEIEKGTLKVRDIVFFKSKDDTRAKEIDTYSFEKVDQEDKIKLATDYRPFGNHFQYTIYIENQSEAPITEMKIKMKFPNFLTFSRCFPTTINIPDIKLEENVNQINIEFDVLNEKSNKQMNLHFVPNSVDNMGEIRTIVTYVNNKDTVRVLDSRPTHISVDKITIEPKVVLSSYIREFSRISGIKNAIKSMGVGVEPLVHPNIFFEILEEVFLNQNFQMVTKDLNNKILWYFGIESLIKQEVLAIGQVISNKIEIIASSSNQYLLISLLTQISNEFKDHLISKRIIKSKDDVFNLECTNCGAILPYFPQKEEPIECKNCKYEQVIW
ncbi:MAG: hypothetical protein ACFFDH_13070 [Promethearchaeota archaeon]